ncbi:hypothetical protein MCOR27_003940 [Pyricularia oryzae]|uniref:Proteasome assembly chaperone 3 n=2 Tax=Pyricularia TaxID=48558 RepID=A0ABQ8NEE4_PYRGI|nr:hypothetical protein MCOR01_005972 [Pyricularia oryzae]KAI6295690.1 hypothetical protein MCOR33_007484 [Pyricularia grisea]KAH9435214.1 hypothetical protein MCOR02_004165 [Pyricularia oryzae]KAI6258761.1 hypothetical protein MCOR19_004861 [Pyricularia oryzae]KAI6282018.1 hypothetical protein MCOR27_003940 [Pyricularia oryzae]
MSSAAVAAATGNDATKTHQISIPLPRSLDTRLYIHLTVRPKSILLMVTTASADEATTPTPLGSFVYAIPDRFNPSQPLCTPLMTVEPTLEFTTRLARLVAKRSGLPTYVGNSVSLMSAGMGGTADEEMEAFRAVVDAVVASLALPSSNGAV